MTHATRRRRVPHASAFATALLCAGSLVYCRVPHAAAQPAATSPSASPTPAFRAVPAVRRPPAPRDLVLPPVPNVESGYRAPSVAGPGGDIVGVTQQPFVGITLQDAIALALARNADIAIARSNRRIAGYQIVAAQGAYDVRFQLQPTYNYQKTAPLSPFQAGPGGGAVTQTTLGASGSFTVQMPNGAQYTIGYSGEGIRSDNTANGFNPYYESAISLGVTQPLLRGRYSGNRRQVELARLSATATSPTALVTVSNTLANVGNTYWDLVAAWRNVAIQEEALRQVRAQAESNARLVRNGAAAPVDVVESNTQVEIDQDNVISAIQNVARLQNQLKQLVLADPADAIWTANLVPTSPALDLPQEPRLQDVVLGALRNRPEIAQIDAQRQTAAVNLAFARDQARPQLDLNVAYTTNGFAGQPASLLANPIFGVFNPVFTSVQQLIAYANAHGAKIPPLTIVFPTTPAAYTGGFGTALTNLFANRLPVATVGVTVGFPLRNRTAKANIAIAAEQQQQVEIQQAALVQRIAFESRNALQQLRAARSRLVAARAARIAAERVYASEVRRFRAGTSTNFLVLQRQTNLANQRGRELQAQTDLNKAVVELQRVMGTIFAQNAVDVREFGNAPGPSATLVAPTRGGANATSTGTGTNPATGRAVETPLSPNGTPAPATTFPPSTSAMPQPPAAARAPPASPRP